MNKTLRKPRRVARSELERERAVLAIRAGSLPTAAQRRTIRAWLRQHCEWHLESVITLAELFWFGARRDDAIPIELIGLSRREIPDLPWSFFERWRKPLCTWHDTDGLGIYVFGPWLTADVASRSGKLEKLIRSPQICSRRLALVGTVVLNRRHETAIPELTLKLVDRVAAERDPLVTKAVSWALRELSKTHGDLVARYVEENSGRLPAIAVREVRNKLRTGLKNPRRRAAATA
jgi:hypothetical protein